MRYIALGMKRDPALLTYGITKHQYYHKSSKGKRGVAASTHAPHVCKVSVAPNCAPRYL